MQFNSCFPGEPASAISLSGLPSLSLMEHCGIPVDEAYSRFTRAMSKAAHSTIPRGVRTMNLPCMDEEAQASLGEYEKSGEPDIANHLIESLDAARRARWE